MTIQRQLTRREREVWAACDHLFSSGITGSNITGEALQTCLGEMGYRKGSFNEIYRYRKTWEQSRNVDLRAPLPPLIKTEPLPDPLLQAVQQVRLILQKESADQIFQVKQETEQVATVLNDELQVARQELAELQRILTEKESINQRLQEEREKAASSIRQLEQDTIHWKAEATRFGHLAGERLKQQELSLNELKTTHQAEIHRLVQQVETNQTSYEKTLNEQKELLEKLRHQWIFEKDQLQTNSLKLEKQLQKAELSVQTSREQIEQLFNQLDESLHKVASLEKENQQLKQSILAQEGTISHYKVRVDKLEQELKDQQRQFLTEHDELIQTKEKANQITIQLRDTRERLLAYESKNKATELLLSDSR